MDGKISPDHDHVDGRENQASTGMDPAQATLTYRPPRWLRNGHVQSVWPTLFRRVALREPEVERLETPDDDFLVLDWYRQGRDRLAILCHGLEGHSRRPYIRGMARALLNAGWDVLAWNYRSCGGVMNRQLRFYHSGATEDLACVVSHVLDQYRYRQLTLVGFSMGGNLALVYLGQQGSNLDERIRGAATFSVPCDLAGSAGQLAEPRNRLYMSRFLKELRVKMAAKAELFPGRISTDGYERIRSFKEFDDRYTAPLHGFRDAEDYWWQCSSSRFIGSIEVPALIVNARDDPFLSPGCYPVAAIRDNPRLVMEMPQWGGHVGFVSARGRGEYWSERRAVQFLGAVSAVS